MFKCMHLKELKHNMIKIAHIIKYKTKIKLYEFYFVSNYSIILQIGNLFEQNKGIFIPGPLGRGRVQGYLFAVLCILSHCYICEIQLECRNISSVLCAM